ncbi:CGNR zinc finger domain-containing protein [Mycolicibacterium iranicum]|uniref:CGNR zinc finger domain-containing protein n=1 Tax=Mycolicibacterium iranicum TaxID=912594 RepID=UPI00160CA3D9|nr:CGNR zinc finger domain-containing protein [Mycolicibacterium iranicum]
MDVSATTGGDEAFLLDLLNTTPVVDDVPTDELSDLAAASTWMTAHGIDATAEERAALVDVREALQRVVRGEAAPTVLDRFLDGVSLTPAVGDAGVSWELTGAGAPARAVLAWDGLRVHSPGRLRPCANTECRLFLIDRSKPNTARWCSMAICGNRMKARRHYQRSKS